MRRNGMDLLDAISALDAMMPVSVNWQQSGDLCLCLAMPPQTGFVYGQHLGGKDKKPAFIRSQVPA
jgi:hypothetical protein